MKIISYSNQFLQHLIERVFYSFEDSSIDKQEIILLLAKQTDTEMCFGKITDEYDTYFLVDDHLFLSRKILCISNHTSGQPKVGNIVKLEVGKNIFYSVLE